MTFRPTPPGKSVKNPNTENETRAATPANSEQDPLHQEILKLVAAAENAYGRVVEAKNPAEAIIFCTQALDLYRRAREKANDNAELEQQTRLGLGKIYSQRGHQQRYAHKHAEAVLDLTQALKLNPAFSDDYYYRALSHLKTGDGKAAKNDFTEYLKRGDDEYLRYAAREHLETLVPKKEDAKANLEYWRNQGTHFNSEATDAIHPRGEAQPDYSVAISYYNKAIEAFNKAIEASPTDMMAKLGLLTAFKDQAQCYRQIAEYDLAIEDYNRAMEVKANPQYIFERGETYRAAGHTDLARTDFEQYLKSGPNSSLKQQAQKYLTEKPAKSEASTEANS